MTDMSDTTLQQQYLATFAAKLETDRRVRAMWLEGSFGRGNADRYSDLDIHLLLADEALDGFRAAAQTILASVRPLVLFNLMFEGRMVNALTVDGLRLDVWLHTGPSKAVDPAKAQVLFTQPGALAFESAAPAANAATTAAHLERQIKEFWRCIALTPAVASRAELITGFMGLVVETNLLADLFLTSHGIVRDRGVKNLNQFLPAEYRRQIEAALAFDGLSVASLAHAHLALADILRSEGPAMAQAHGFHYPAELEAAVLRYVHAELEHIGLTDVEQ